MQAQIETILPQSKTWQLWKDRLLIPLLVVGGLVTVVWNVALLAVTLSFGLAVAGQFLS